MKKQIALALVALAASVPSAQAFIPSSSITKAAMAVYGIYVTADPTCMTGLVAARALKKDPEMFDFAAGSSLGKFKAPADGINCVIFVGKGQMEWAWTAGTYTTSSRFGTGVFPDSSCNAGGSDSMTDTSKAFTCMSGRSKTIVWPEQIKADMTALGMDFEETDCETSKAANLAPIFVSSYSKCIGDTALDEAIGGACDWTLYSALNPGDGGYRANTLFKAPTAADDATAGAKLGTVTKGKKKFKFVMTPMIGGTGSDPTTAPCGIMGPPVFSFADAD